ncbi:DUF2171 domain-containing protein [Tundrisphaera sp. TA3]|uniref:DUF2171 domain-containing protein n=1 Tax=Tundrisphaera sp. TA3 TaxID=3435775 RepID=UPI003EBC2C77
MADSIKDKLQDAGNKISEAATRVGHAVGEKVEETADWAKETAHKAGNRIEEMAQKVEHSTGASLGSSTGATGSTADIKEHQDVYASCGTKVGRVDHVEGSNIRLTRGDSPDGMHHLIPLSWVAKVHDHIHLNKDHVEVQSQWTPA